MAYPHISPGDKFRPNAEKENALSRLLDKSGVPTSVQGASFPEERSVSLAYNCGKTTILADAPAEIVFKMTAAEKLPVFTVGPPSMLVKSAAGTAPEFWGIALEEIPAGSLGPVQISGVSICTKIAPPHPEMFHQNTFISVNKEGGYFYSGIGAARVLRYNTEQKTALVYLDQNNVYRGPFAVRFDGSSLSVIDGRDPEGPNSGTYWINGNFLSARKRAGITPSLGYLCLTASAAASGPNDALFEVADDPSFPGKSGEKAKYPIAEIQRDSNGRFLIFQLTRWTIPQLWTFEDCETEE